LDAFLEQYEVYVQKRAEEYLATASAGTAAKKIVKRATKK
jgi:hypothetical protein